MTRILVPTDFSDNAMHAAKYAAAIFGPTGNSYSLFHAFFNADISGPLIPGYAGELMKASEEGMRHFVARFKKITGAEKSDHHIAYGPLTLVLNEHLAEHPADIVVMGKRGETGSALLGSNTTDVIKRSTIPVLVVPETAPITPIKRILFANDRDRVHPESLGMLTRLARHCGAEVLIAHVPEPVPRGELLLNANIYDAMMEHVQHSFLELPGDDVVDGLDQAAQGQRVDMIALLHRHKGLLDRIFHPSMAKDLALHSKWPLLVLQEKV